MNNNNIKSVISQISEANPDSSINELKNIFLNCLEDELPMVFSYLSKKIDPNYVHYLRSKLKIKLKRRKGFEAERLKDEFINKVELINLIHSSGYSYNKYGFDLQNDVNNLSVQNYSLDNIQNELVINPLEHLISNSYKYSTFDYNENAFSKPSIKMETEIDPLENKPSELYILSKLVNAISGDKLDNLNVYFDYDFGKLINIRVHLNSTDAFKLWLNLLDEVEQDYQKIINLEWNGENDLTEDEFVDYAVEIMLKSGVGPIALNEFDAIEAVSEGRN